MTAFGDVPRSSGGYQVATFVPISALRGTGDGEMESRSKKWPLDVPRVLDDVPSPTDALLPSASLLRTLVSTTSSPPELHVDLTAVEAAAANPHARKPKSMASPNARTREETQAEGEDTFGVR